MAGSPQPFQAFLDEHRQVVLSFLRTTVGPQDAEDVFQETFLAALRGYRKMDGRHPRAWVLTIARRKAIDHHRAGARRPEPRGELPEPGAARRDGVVDEGSFAGDGAGHPWPETGDVWGAVAELSLPQRAAIALRFAADLPYAEIGAALECSEQAARRRVHDGLRALRKRIDEEVDR